MSPILSTKRRRAPLPRLRRKHTPFPGRQGQSRSMGPMMALHKTADHCGNRSESAEKRVTPPSAGGGANRVKFARREPASAISVTERQRLLVDLPARFVEFAWQQVAMVTADILHRPPLPRFNKAIKRPGPKATWSGGVGEWLGVACGEAGIRHNR